MTAPTEIKVNKRSNTPKSNIPIRKAHHLLFEMKKNKVLYLMMFPGLLFLAIFSYYPLLGIQIAFRDYNVMDGMWKSPFVGFKYFEAFFKSPYAGELIFNTLYLNILFIITGTLFAIIIAILLNELVNNILKKSISITDVFSILFIVGNHFGHLPTAF